MARKAFTGPHFLAPKGSTGNQTHAGVNVAGDFNVASFQLVVEAVGATPTVTWKIQGSLDGVKYADIVYLPQGSELNGVTTAASDTSATAALVSGTVVANDRQMIALSLSHLRKYRFFRVITSANTNVTYRVEAYLGD